MDIYYPFAADPAVPIAIELYLGDHSVVDNRIIPHKHAYHELALIRKGTCRHFYHRTEAVLIPGDMVLIPPHQNHAFQIMGRHECFNLQFYAGRLGSRWEALMSCPALDPPAGAGAQMLSALSLHARAEPDAPAPNAQQEILHLSPNQAQEVENIMETMLHEQESRLPGYQFVLHSMIELIFVTIRRAQLDQYTALQNNPSHHRELVAAAMGYIEAHLQENICFDELAAAAHISAGHFRKIFKQVSGLSPVEYLNRLRIVKSLGFLQSENLSVAEASEKVGINDPNYYARLFKKIIGYPPRYFKNIPEEL